MENIQKEIHQVLTKSDAIPFETIQSEQNSPLNQSVVASDKENIPFETKEQQAENTTTTTDGEPSPEQLPPEDTDDAPPQEINENTTDAPFSGDDAAFELPASYAKQAADSILGISDNVLEVGGGYFVKIRKHQEFYEFEEIIQVIDKQNKKNLKRIKLDKDDKILLRPILVAILKTKAKKLTPEQQLLGAVISILMKKAQTVMEIKAENTILTERILAIVKAEKGDVAQDEDEQDDDIETEQQEPENQEETPAPIISKEDDDSSDIPPETFPFEEHRPQDISSETSPPDSYRDGGLQGATERVLEVAEDNSKETPEKDEN